MKYVEKILQGLTFEIPVWLVLILILVLGIIF